MYTDKEQKVIDQAKSILASKTRKGDAFGSTAFAKDYFQIYSAQREHEVFGVVFLDSQHQLIAHEEMFRGTIDGAAVYPREVVKAALAHNAAAVVFSHNHPSGVAEPSRADIAITRKLKDALQTVGIRVLDHLVVGLEECVSLQERGLI